MKAILLAVGASLTLCACAASGPSTAWGKEGVTMMDYRTDGGQCAVYAATATPETIENNQAGGISGSNETVRLPPPKTGPIDPGSNQPTAPTGDSFPTGGGGAYRDGNNSDLASRAANQQQMREVAVAKARTSGYEIRPHDKRSFSAAEATELLRINRELFKQCRYREIQTAVTDSGNNDRVVVMPGLYEEPTARAKPTDDPACDKYQTPSDSGDPGALSHDYQLHCPNDANLVAVIGRGPDTGAIPNGQRRRRRPTHVV